MSAGDDRTTAERIAAGEPCPICKRDPQRLTHFHDPLDVFAPRDGMTYAQRAEFERLKHADVEQGRRIAELLKEFDALREVAREVMRHRDELVEQNHTLERAVRDAVELAATRMSAETYHAQRAEIEALTKRVAELEAENERIAANAESVVVTVGQIQVRVDELLSENAQLAAENRALRIEVEQVAHERAERAEQLENEYEEHEAHEAHAKRARETNRGDILHENRIPHNGCDDCDPSFGCFSNVSKCCKKLRST